MSTAIELIRPRKMTVIQALRLGRVAAFVAAITILPFLAGVAAGLPIVMSDKGPCKIHKDGDPLLPVIGWEHSATTAECVGGGTTYYECMHVHSDPRKRFARPQPGLQGILRYLECFRCYVGRGGRVDILVNGGAAPGGKFQVLGFKATATDLWGGLEIFLHWAYAGADRGDYYWSQALFHNYEPGPLAPVKGGTTGPLRYKMDVDKSAQPKYAPPLYPFQRRPGDPGADKLAYYFGDGPRGPWPDSMFWAQVFLSKPDYAAHTLTIYEGVFYKFELSADLDPPTVPEPSTMGLLLVGLLVLGVRTPTGVKLTRSGLGALGANRPV